ncbi:MAG TPA: MBL fold metallo-hydrolase [Anaeromyxobacteraceae bacterium]|nr:MBL fold metallo-hydrolase [Anaeromyxobacteraceae bacterium]
MLALGRYRLAALETGSFALDGGALFGAIPRLTWERLHRPDERHRVRLAARALLVLDTLSGRRLLVDDGPGSRWDGERADRLAVESRGVEDALSRHGLAPADVTDVILTHLHPSHAGGTLRPGAAGRPELAFPRATHHLQRRHWQWAQAPSERDRASFRPADLEILHHSNRLHLLDGEAELFPDLDLVVSEGHTPGQQLPRIRGDGTHLVCCGDLIPTRAHLQPTWIAAWDLHPMTALEEKKVLVAQALEEDGILFFSHDPEVAAGRLGEKDGQPVFRGAVAL